MAKLNEFKALQDSLEVISLKEQVAEVKATQDFRVKKLAVKLKALQTDYELQSNKLEQTETELFAARSELEGVQENCVRM